MVDVPNNLSAAELRTAITPYLEAYIRGLLRTSPHAAVDSCAKRQCTIAARATAARVLSEINEQRRREQEIYQ